MLRTSANPTRRINVSSGVYYAVLPSVAIRPFILVTCPYLPPTTPPWAAYVHICTCCKQKRYSLAGLGKFIPEGLKSLVQWRAFVPHVRGLSYQSIDAAPVSRLHPRAVVASPCGAGMLMAMQIASGLATSADIDLPAGVGRGWRMDCHLWMKGDWDPLTPSPSHLKGCRLNHRSRQLSTRLRSSRSSNVAKSRKGSDRVGLVVNPATRLRTQIIQCNCIIIRICNSFLRETLISKFSKAAVVQFHFHFITF